MSTQKQIEANRRNARRSTAPKTPQGKARSALNALKHGIRSTLAVIPSESLEDFETLYDAIRPDNPAPPPEIAQTNPIRPPLLPSQRKTRGLLGEPLSRMTLPRFIAHPLPNLTAMRKLRNGTCL